MPDEACFTRSHGDISMATMVADSHTPLQQSEQISWLSAPPSQTSQGQHSVTNCQAQARSLRCGSNIAGGGLRDQWKVPWLGIQRTRLKIRIYGSCLIDWFRPSALLARKGIESRGCKQTSSMLVERRVVYIIRGHV